MESGMSLMRRGFYRIARVKSGTIEKIIAYVVK